MTAGRKTYWDIKIEPRLFEIAGWARDGYTDKQICEALGVSIPTFYKWKAIKIELLNALKVNKAIADLTVENSLFKRANGYEYEETMEEQHKDATGNTTSTHVKVTTKVVLPDTTAQIFWLKNRKKKEWLDTKNLLHTGADGGPIETINSNMDPKKAAQLYAQLLKGDK
jgi:hypothetical protein